MIQTLDLKLVILLECQNIKIFLQNITFQLFSNTARRAYVISQPKGEAVIGRFYETEL